MANMIYPDGEISSVSPTPPDVFYVRSRSDLLQYEDARFNGLIQALANFYVVENDQSLWGDMMRATAQELAHFDYFYNYDLVSKNPVFLTPPDIKRRWAANLYINRLYPTLDPTQYDLAYKAMLIALIPAYQQGATVDALEAIITAYTGLTIKVVELYTLIGQGIYDQSDRNTISVSIIVGGSNPLDDVTQLNQLESITNALYGAIDLGKPAHVGLDFQAVFGAGDNLDCRLSPSYLNAAQYAAMPTTEQGYYTTYAYALINPIGTWTPNAPYSLNTVITDSKGNAQQVTTPGTSNGSAVPSWNSSLNGTTSDGSVVWTNVGSALQYQITIPQWNALSTALKALYQLLYANTNCVNAAVGGINDSLQIFFQLLESESYNPMLYLAPDLLASTPRTGLGPSTAPTIWLANHAYPKGSLILVGGFLQLVTTAGTSGSVVPTFNPTSGATTTDNTVTWTNAGSPTIVWPATTIHNPTPSVWRPSTHYNLGEQVTDTSGYVQQVTTAGTTGAFFPSFNATLGGTTSDGGVVWTNEGYQYSINQSILDPNQFVQVISIAGSSFSAWESGAHYATNQLIVDVNGYVQKATTGGMSGANYPVFDEAINATTADGTVTWTTQYQFQWNQAFGGVTIDGGAIWVNFGRAPGLVAPRIDQVWEVKSDTFLGLDVS